jgi:hypothetical protein
MLVKLVGGRRLPSYAFAPYLVDYQSRQRELDAQLFHFCVWVDLVQTGVP